MRHFQKLTVVLSLAMVIYYFAGCLPEPVEKLIGTDGKALLVILENNANIPKQIEDVGDMLAGLDIPGYTDYFGC